MSLSDVEIVLHDLGIDILGESPNKETGEPEWKARCPFHKGGTAFDHNPGWYIHDDGGAHICFSCGYAGGLEVLVRDVLGIQWEEAVAWLNQRIDPLQRLAARSAWAPRERREPSVPLAPVNEARLLALDPVPPERLAERHLDARTAQAFGIRWDASKEAWILPIRRADNTLLGWQVKGTGPDRLFRNYPHGVPKSTTLFGYHLLRGNDEVAVVESPLDAARLHRLGYPAVATYGAKVSVEQMRLLLDKSGSVVWAMDNPKVDDAGLISSLAVMGIDGRGRDSDRITDYSKLTVLSFFNYADADAKDVGDLTDRQIHYGMEHLLHSLHRRKVFAQ